MELFIFLNGIHHPELLIVSLLYSSQFSFWPQSILAKSFLPLLKLQALQLQKVLLLGPWRSLVPVPRLWARTWLLSPSVCCFFILASQLLLMLSVPAWNASFCFSVLKPSLFKALVRSYLLREAFLHAACNFPLSWVLAAPVGHTACWSFQYMLPLSYRASLCSVYWKARAPQSRTLLSSTCPCRTPSRFSRVATTLDRKFYYQDKQCSGSNKEWDLKTHL